MMKKVWLLCFFTGLLTAVSGGIGIAEHPCNAVLWQEYEGSQLWRIPGKEVYAFTSDRMQIDADGAPNAYHPQDKGIDALVNADYPDGDWKSILVQDPGNGTIPFVQREGEFKDYFVSMTALQDVRKQTTDIARYVDARHVPYIVLPRSLYKLKGTGSLGDVAVVRNIGNGRESPAIIADIGPLHSPLGEVSIRLAENLGGSNVNPRNGAGKPKGPFLWIVFPKTKFDPRWPVNNEDLRSRARDLLSEVGGWDQISNCVH